MTQDRVRRLTLRDVAAELGVSAKTVSNAYVHPDQLSVELRQRIIDTAARLGYPGPDPIAAGLLTNHGMREFDHHVEIEIVRRIGFVLRHSIFHADR